MGSKATNLVAEILAGESLGAVLSSLKIDDVKRSLEQTGINMKNVADAILFTKKGRSPNDVITKIDASVVKESLRDTRNQFQGPQDIR